MTQSMPALDAAALEQAHALHRAVLAGDTDLVRSLLAKGAYVGEIARFGGSPLHWAAPRRQFDICKLLFEAGVDVNGRDGTERTPLINAAAVAPVEACAFLIKSGASVNVKDDRWRTPLHEAALRNDSAICSLLLDSGADIAAVDENGHTPAHNAIGRLSSDLCRLFEERRPGTWAMRVAGSDTPFEYAVYRGALDAVRFYVLECGADLDHQTLEGKTLVELAGRNERMVLLLSSLRTEVAVREAVSVAGEACAPSAVRRSGPVI